jgi:hypothetical protein
MILPVALALLAINAWTILRFWQDKSRAVAGCAASRRPICSGWP